MQCFLLIPVAGLSARNHLGACVLLTPPLYYTTIPLWYIISFAMSSTYKYPSCIFDKCPSSLCRRWLILWSHTRPRNEPKVQYNRDVRSVFRPENSSCLPRVKTSSRADLATSRSCHSDPVTNIQTTSFGPSLDDLSNWFPFEKPQYVSYST